MPTTVFINEFHYDNVGTDTGESVEIVAPVSTSLSGWRLVLYNGANPSAAVPYTSNSSFALDAMSVVVRDLGNGFKTLVVNLPTDGLQNGGNDGFALVDAGGQVVQFLSYEGVMTASGGPAAGLISVDIGRAESNATPVGTSLQLTGTGMTYEDFTWAPSATATFGSANNGQTLGTAPTPGVLSIGDTSLAEGNSGDTLFTFTVTRSGGSSGAVSASYALSVDDTATSAEVDDFGAGTTATGNVSFADGQTTATVTIRVAGDTEVETDEQFEVTLFAPTGGATLASDASATGTILNDDAAPVVGRAFINEILYDNSGLDTAEAIEVAGTAGLSLQGWTLVLYNGNGGASYQTIALSGVIPNQDDGNGTLTFAPATQNTLQNGSPDGIALVDANGAVVQFLSYEGAFIASNGAAAGMTSTDIGVAQTGSEPATLSLQLKGAGTEYEDFDWTAASLSSFGSVNAGQDFVVGNPNGTLRVRDASVVEGNNGTTALTFTVDRTGGSTGAVTADYSVALGSGTSFASAADLSGATTGTVTFAAGQTSATVTIQVVADTTPEADERFTVNLVNATGGANIGRPAATGTILNDDLLQLRVFEIQGADHRSPFEGQTVATGGIVTAIAGNGYYLQDATGDGNAATSDGVFVFTGSAPAGIAVGDAITLTGRIEEFVGSDPTLLPLTELVPVGPPTVVSSGNALPAAVLISPDGVRPPTENLEDDGLTSYDPTTDGLDFYESLEGMLVTIDSPQAVARTEGGGVWTVASNGTELLASNVSSDGHVVIDGGAGGFGVVNSGAGSDFNPERILIGALSGAVPTVQAGAVFNDVTGVVSYRSANYTVLATAAPTVAVAAPAVSDPTTLAGSANQLLVSSYNVLNLDPNDAAARFTRIARDIGSVMKGPDIVILQEVQDNDGATNSSVTSASATLQKLVDAIFTETGARYAFIDNTFIADDANGGEPGGNIRVAMLYRADRVELVADSVRAIPAASQAAGQATDSSNPFFASRPPLVADFVFNAETITVVGNHFTSKDGSGALQGAVQPSAAGGEAKRTAQAAIVNDFVDTLLAADANAKVIVAGDLNEFQFEEPLQVLTGAQTFSNGAITGAGAAVLENLTYRLPANERYSFVFDGNAQQIDHVLVTAGLQTGAQIDILHVNRDEFASDHDPVLVQLTVATPLVTQTGTAGVDQFRGTAGRDQLVGNEGDDRLGGFEGNDVLDGGAGNDTLDGGAGNDRMTGGTGDDTYAVDTAGDRVIETSNGGYDRVRTTLVTYTLGDDVEELQFQSTADATGTGNALNNTVFGNSGADTLSGLDGDDRLVGRAGDDVLVGGAGKDVLEGGIGADRFVFATGDFTAAINKPDVIKDFDVNSSDLIDLAGAGATSFIGSSAFTKTAGEVRAQVVAGFTFVLGDVDGDGVADYAIQLTGVQALTGNDFVLSGGVLL